MRLDLIRVGLVRFWRLNHNGMSTLKVFWADVPIYEENWRVYMRGAPWFWARENDGSMLLELLRREMEAER